MAVDLEGYERAYRLRSSADGELLRQIFGEKELEGLNKTNPALIETARAYFPHLTSSTYERLIREPDTLQLEKDRCEREMEQLAVQNYSAFISNAEVTKAVRQEFVGIQKHLDDMVQMMQPVQSSIEEFQAAAAGLGIRRSALRNVQQQHGLLVDLLELPQLLDACIRNQMYDESLELLSYCGTMFQGHEARGEDIPAMANLQEQVAVQRTNLHNSLVAQLKTDIHLPACVRIIGFLRRLQQHSEDELRRLFVEHRGSFLEGHKQQVEALRASRGSVVTALNKAAELLRDKVFEIGMQYQALFGQEDGPLCVWLSEQIMWLVGLLQAHVLPPQGAQAQRAQLPDPSARRAGAGPAGLRGASNTARIDAAALLMVLRQCLHASSTLKRLGGHFFPAVAGIFEARMEHHVCEMLDVGILTFQAELGRYDWVASTALAGGGAGAAPSMAGGESAPSQAGQSWLHPQALELTRHRPLAVFTNDLVQVFNEIRQCTLYGLRVQVVHHCYECLIGAVNLLRSIASSPPFQAGSAKANEFSRLCAHFAHILTPLVAAHLDLIFGTSARLDTAAVVASMVPDLLPQAEVELAMPPEAEGGSWEAPAAQQATVSQAPAVAVDAAAASPPVSGAENIPASMPAAASPAPAPPGPTAAAQPAATAAPAVPAVPAVTAAPAVPVTASAAATAAAPEEL